MQFVNLHLYYLISITYYSKIRIMSNHDYLTFLLSCFYKVDQILEYALIVKVFFWLVYYQRFVIHINK